jgi:type I restriction enzyme S subunit
MWYGCTWRVLLAASDRLLGFITYEDTPPLSLSQSTTFGYISAQTLFRHWFIETADDDWDEKPLDEIADYLNGLACQKYPPENEVAKLPVLKIRELRNGTSDKTDWATTNVPQKYIVENGDVIFSWSGSLMVKIWDGEKCVLNQHLFKVTSDRFPKWFFYLWTTHHLQKFIAIAESKATTMGHIKRRDLSNSMVLIPKQSELVEMDQVLAPLIDKIILNNQQIMKLTALRDTLLPKLMSGEVRVSLDNSLRQ